MLQGYSQILHTKDHEIRLAYEKCHQKIDFEKQKEQRNLIQSLYMPKEILNAEYDKIDVDIKRGQAIREASRSEEHTSELQSRGHLVCRLLLEKKKQKKTKKKQ